MANLLNGMKQQEQSSLEASMAQARGQQIAVLLALESLQAPPRPQMW